MTADHPQRWIGRHVDELDTPVLIVDLEGFESNVAAMATYCRRQEVAWRPHSKSHKSPDIARIQLAAGALGLTCAKLSEAEVFVEGPRRMVRTVESARTRSWRLRRPLWQS